MFQVAEKALKQGKLDKALTKLRKRFKRLAGSPETQGLIYGFPKADAICQGIGMRLVENMKGTGKSEVQHRCAKPGVDVYLVSTIYETGGHTGLIGDLVRASGKRGAHLLVTQTNGKSSDTTERALARTGIRRDNIECCVENSLLGKLKWLISRLESLKPNRVFLIHHPDDVVAASAIVPQLSDQFLFLHHVESRPSLGLYAHGVIHFDLTPFRYHYCRTWVGIESNFYLPITCPDQNVRNPIDWKAQAGVYTTASSGSPQKFSTQYQPTYGETVACILKTTRGRHVHIGALPNAMLDQIYQSLDDAGIEKGAFQHVEHVDSLWQAMSEWKVDVYLNSFPAPGARASVEVVGSGTPVLWHVRSKESQYEDTHMRYPEALCWKNLAGLRQHLSQADGPWLVAQSCAARRQYERFHNPKGWGATFADDVLRPTFSPPAFEGYRAWDQNQRFREHWEAYSMLREKAGLPNPMERNQRYRRVKMICRRFFP